MGFGNDDLVGVEPALHIATVEVGAAGLADGDIVAGGDVFVDGVDQPVLLARLVRPIQIVLDKGKYCLFKQVETGIIQRAARLAWLRVLDDTLVHAGVVFFDNAVLTNILGRYGDAE